MNRGRDMGHIHPCSPAYLILITREPCLLPELLDRTDGGGGEGRVDGGEVDKWGTMLRALARARPSTGGGGEGNNAKSVSESKTPNSLC